MAIRLNDEELKQVTGGNPGNGETQNCKVFLASIIDKLKAMQGLKNVLGISAGEAKAMTESSLPLLICENVTYEYASDLATRLENSGGVSCMIEAIV